MDFSKPISMYGIGTLVPPHWWWLRLSEWLRSRPRSFMHLDKILPGFCRTCQMSTIFPKNSSELCTLTYHAMMNCDNHTISQYDIVCCDPSYLSESSSLDDQALVESTEKDSWTCRIQMVTSYQMFNLLACSRNVFFLSFWLQDCYLNEMHPQACW